jgi:hypothetical protein
VAVVSFSLSGDLGSANLSHHSNVVLPEGLEPSMPFRDAWLRARCNSRYARGAWLQERASNPHAPYGAAD